MAACGDCAPELEALGKALLEARVRYAGQQAKVDDLVRLMTLLVNLIEAVGPPFEPVQGSVFAGWLARLDKPTAQGAWRLLAEVKRKAMGGERTSVPAERGPRDRTAARPLSIETARFRRQIVVPPIQPFPVPPAPPTNPLSARWR